MDCIVHGVAKSWRQLSDFHFHCSSVEIFQCVWNYTLNFFTDRTFWILATSSCENKLLSSLSVASDTYPDFH